MHYKVDAEFNEDKLKYLEEGVFRAKDIAELEVASQATDLAKKHITLELGESRRGNQKVIGDFVILSGESWNLIKGKLHMLEEVMKMAGYNKDTVSEIINNIEKEV